MISVPDQVGLREHDTELLMAALLENVHFVADIIGERKRTEQHCGDR